MKTKRVFVPGDEWIYYQLSCGPNTSDKVLVGCIKDFANLLLESKKIDKWFFVRYDDPNFHLRVRFRAVSKSFVSEIYQMFNIEISHLLKRKIIWKVSIDTYQREIERYGDNTIELVENIFFYESKLICKILSILQESNLAIEELRWQACIYVLDKLIEHCFEDINTQVEQTNFMFQTFLMEFDDNKELKKKLDEKYRLNKPKIITALSGSFFNAKQIERELFEYIDSIKRIKENNPTITNRIGGSLMHMVCNRFFHSETRLKELVLYFFLVKKYNSDRFLNK
jgi:thiopeptide-type bacteriocin biosynthesis protein